MLCVARVVLGCMESAVEFYQSTFVSIDVPIIISRSLQSSLNERPHSLNPLHPPHPPDTTEAGAGEDPHQLCHQRHWLLSNGHARDSRATWRRDSEGFHNCVGRQQGTQNKQFSRGHDVGDDQVEAFNTCGASNGPEWYVNCSMSG